MVLEIINTIAQGIIAVGGVGTLTLNYFQLRDSHKQVNQTQEIYKHSQDIAQSTNRVRKSVRSE